MLDCKYYSKQIYLQGCIVIDDYALIHSQKIQRLHNKIEILKNTFVNNRQKIKQ